MSVLADKNQTTDIEDDEPPFTPFPTEGKIELKTEDYTPWNESYSYAVLCAGVSIFVLWFGSIAENVFGLEWKTNSLIVSGAFVLLSFFYYSRGSTREFGKSFELKWVEKAQRALEGSGLTMGQSRMTRGGDIDLLVLSENQRKFNVEIKAWKSWEKDQKKKSREKAALKQIQAQMNDLDAEASILWLPQGEETFAQALFGGKQRIGENIYLCRGNARKLKRALLKLAK